MHAAARASACTVPWRYPLVGGRGRGHGAPAGTLPPYPPHLTSGCAHVRADSPNRSGLAKAPFVVEQGLQLEGLSEAVCLCVALPTVLPNRTAQWAATVGARLGGSAPEALARALSLPRDASTASFLPRVVPDQYGNWFPVARGTGSLIKAESLNAWPCATTESLNTWPCATTVLSNRRGLRVAGTAAAFGTRRRSSRPM